MMKPSETMRFLRNAGSPGWATNYPGHYETYKKLLALAEAVEKADPEQLFQEYMKSHGENVLPILHAALALKGK
jgi:hypothetical protein